MRKFGLTLAAAIAATLAAAPVSAATTIAFTSPTSTVNGATDVQTFDKFATGSQIVAPGFANVFAYNSDVTDMGRTPTGTHDNYAAILGGGSYTLSLAAATPVLSFLAGSIDTWNSVTLNLVDAAGKTSQLYYAGADLGSGDERITFDTHSATTLITGAVFASSQNSFEIDSIVSAAPEPATWAMMILGFGFAGMGLRSARRSRGRLALA